MTRSPRYDYGMNSVAHTLSALPAERKVSALIEFWCSGASRQMQVCLGKNGLTRDIQEHVTRSYGDIETLDNYLHAYCHWNIVPALWDKNGQPVEAALLEDMEELLAFPYRMGMDPSDPETVAWAKFFVPYTAGGSRMYRKRAEWKNVAKLRKAGVPLDYAEALDTPTWDAMMPIRRIIPLYRAGIAAEYAHVILYGESA